MAGAVIVATSALFLIGVITGVIALVATAARREDRLDSLVSHPGGSPGEMVRGVRRLTGFGRRAPTLG